MLLDMTWKERRNVVAGRAFENGLLDGEGFRIGG